MSRTQAHPNSLGRAKNRLASESDSAAGLPLPHAGDGAETVAKPFTLIVADSHALIRHAMCSLLNNAAGLSLLGSASDGDQAVHMVREHRPDVALIDTQMPALNGIQATERIREISPDTQVLGVSSQEDPCVIKRMFQAGATGFITKDTSVSHMIAAARAVAAGEIYLCPRTAQSLISAFVLEETDSSPSPLAVLTRREQEVAQMLSEGLTTREIAEKLGVSVKTIDTHRYQVLRKLDLRGIADLTRLAIKEGFTPLGVGSQKSTHVFAS